LPLVPIERGWSGGRVKPHRKWIPHLAVTTDQTKLFLGDFGQPPLLHLRPPASVGLPQDELPGASHVGRIIAPLALRLGERRRREAQQGTTDGDQQQDAKTHDAPPWSPQRPTRRRMKRNSALP